MQPNKILNMEANRKQILIDKKDTTPKQRDERIDSVKYWLIVLVIAGHVFSRPEFSGSSACTVLWKWIYIFHMPLFIFISGYFSNRKNGGKIWAGIWILLEPLIICQVLRLIPFILNGSISISDILTPQYALWYLLSLIYYRLIIQILPEKILNNSKLIVTASFIISIIAGFLPFNRFLTMQRALSLMPFFFLGYCMKGRNLFLPSKFKPLHCAFLILSLALPIFFQQYLGELEHHSPYNDYHDVFSRIFIFTISIPMSLAFINICPNIPWAARQGRLTMQYYIYHTLIVLQFVSIISKLNFPMTYLSATIYTAIITISLGIASYLPYFSKLTNPSSLLNSTNIWFKYWHKLSSVWKLLIKQNQ